MKTNNLSICVWSQKKPILFIVIFAFLSVTELSASIYFFQLPSGESTYSVNELSHWTDGSQHPSGFTNSDDIFIVSGGITVETNAPWSVAGSIQLSGTLLVKHQLTVSNLSTYNGSQTTVIPGADLTVTNAFVCNGSLTLGEYPSASGTLAATLNLPTSVSGSGICTYQQYLTAGRNWYISSPVVYGDMPAPGYKYNEPAASWVVVNQSSRMGVGVGYIVVPSATGTVSFATQITNVNNANSDVTLKKEAIGQYSGFNLIGNPYPTYLNAALLNFSNMTETIWYRSHNGTAYIFPTVNIAGSVSTFGASNIIPPMQGFWVRTNENDHLFTFTRDARATGTGVLRAHESDSNALLRLQLCKGDNIVDETVLYSNTDASNSFDRYDSPKLQNGASNTIGIYTIVNSERLTINGVPQLNLNEEIPLGFQTYVQGTNFKLKLSEIKNIPANVFIKDGAKETDLTENGEYAFESNVYDGINRFSIIFRTKNNTTQVKKNTDKNTTVFVNANGLIQVNSPANDHTVAKLYNVAGQCISTSQMISGSTVFNAMITAGIYWVKITEEDNTLTRKVIVN